MNDRPIAVFDSGLGGLTVVRELARTLGGEDILYLGDTARVPYGIKSLETVRRFAFEDAAFLLKRDPKLLVVACNTASAAATDALKARCPVDVVDVIRPGVAAALEAVRDRPDAPVAVIGTEATVASGAYQDAFAASEPERRVVAGACPLLVPIVEEGRGEADPIVLSVLSEYLRDIQRARPGALVLGCTHYPLLAGAIAKLMGPDVAIVSSAAAAAADVQRRLSLAGRLSPRAGGGRLECFTTDNADRFRRLGERFGGRSLDCVTPVPADELEAGARQWTGAPAASPSAERQTRM